MRWNGMSYAVRLEWAKCLQKCISQVVEVTQRASRVISVGTESEIVPGVFEIINLSVLSMLYHAEPTGAVLFPSMHNSHTHESRAVHARSALGTHPPRLQLFQLHRKNVFSL